MVVHRVKCNGEIFYVSSGHMRDALSTYSPADSDSACAVRQALSRTRLRHPNLQEIERAFGDAGYLDFDGLMDGNLPAVGHYFEGVFRGKRTQLCGVNIVATRLGEGEQPRTE